MAPTLSRVRSFVEFVRFVLAPPGDSKSPQMEKELQAWMMEEAEDPSLTARSWTQRVPWHYLWAFLGFTLISALIWGADWILGLSTVAYRL